jgi:hypothetical protein
MLLTPATCQRVNARTKSPNIDVNPNTSHCISHNKAPPPPPPPRTAHCTYYLTAEYKALLQCASDPTMAPTLYPRGTVKKIVKAHSNRQMSKNVDILVRLMGYRRTNEKRKAIQEHKTNMQHRSISIMRCLCKSTYRPPDIIPLRDGDTTCIPCATIRNVIDSEAAER